MPPEFTKLEYISAKQSRGALLALSHQEEPGN